MAVAQKSEPKVRVQVVTPRSSRRVSKARPGRSNAIALGRYVRGATALAKPAAVMAALLLFVWGYRTLADSSLFEVRHIDVNEVDPALRADVEQAARRAVGQTKLLDVDLDEVRRKVEAIPRVRAASVARALPGSLYVRVVERQAAVLVRRESKAIVWLDDDAVEIGDVSAFKPDDREGIPPLATGFSEGHRSQGAVAEDRERVSLYKQIKQELTAGERPMWNLVDEIDLSFLKDVNLRLTDPPVTVHLGSKDFRNRFETALKILDAIGRGDSEMLSRFRVRDPDRLIQNAQYINFIDAARPDRIVLNFSTPGTEKTVRQEPKKKGE